MYVQTLWILLLASYVRVSTALPGPEDAPASPKPAETPSSAAPAGTCASPGPDGTCDSPAMTPITLKPRTANSCYRRCHEEYDRKNWCHCDWHCPEFGNCCKDFHDLCPNWGNSCAGGRCGASLNIEYSCQCDELCQKYEDCCVDYVASCLEEPGPVEPPKLTDPNKPPVATAPEPVKTNSGSSCAESTSKKTTSDELSCLAQLLWDSDVNRASSEDYQLHKQGQISKSALSRHRDLAKDNLFTFVDEAELFTRSTFAAYVKLFDNYVAATGTDEEVTPAETEEVSAFINAIQNTDVIVKLHEFLSYKGLASPDLPTFMSDLKEMWFGLYSRSKGHAMDSSGFEHVFLGEFKRSKVSGFHNWITMYLREKHGHTDYFGYIWDKQPGILAIQLRWQSLYKELGSMFYGVSPEFDLAIYTMCFYTFPDKLCRFNMAGEKVAVQTWTYGGGKYVGSAYPA